MFPVYQSKMIRDVTEPVNIASNVSCAKSVGFGCGYGIRHIPKDDALGIVNTNSVTTARSNEHLTISNNRETLI